MHLDWLTDLCVKRVPPTRECRERGLMYTAPVRATFRVQRDDIGSMPIERSLGDLPIMVCSNCCRLAGKSPAELVELKEEASECGGYFIVNGIERVIRLLQVSKDFNLFTPEGLPVCCPRHSSHTSIFHFRSIPGDASQSCHGHQSCDLQRSWHRLYR